MYLIREHHEEVPNSIKETLASLAKTMGLPVSTSTYFVYDSWESIVGEYLSTQTKPISLTNHTLLIAASNSTVAKEMQLRGPELVNSINEILNMQVVDKIEVKTGANYARKFRYSG